MDQDSKCKNKGLKKILILGKFSEKNKTCCTFIWCPRVVRLCLAQCHTDMEGTYETLKCDYTHRERWRDRQNISWNRNLYSSITSHEDQSVLSQWLLFRYSKSDSCWHRGRGGQKLPKMCWLTLWVAPWTYKTLMKRWRDKQNISWNQSLLSQWLLFRYSKSWPFVLELFVFQLNWYFFHQWTHLAQFWLLFHLRKCPNLSKMRLLSCLSYKP